MNEEEKELILAQDKAQGKAQDEIVNEKISNMNEEEKQAIDWLKEELDDEKKSCKNCNYSYKGVTGLYGNNEVEIALKLIEKQQKEIENHTFNDKVVLETLKECVTKRSIRKLIKEKAKTDTYNFRTIAVKDIEELLGE